MVVELPRTQYEVTAGWSNEMGSQSRASAGGVFPHWRFSLSEFIITPQFASLCCGQTRPTVADTAIGGERVESGGQ